MTQLCATKIATLLLSGQHNNTIPVPGNRTHTLAATFSPHSIDIYSHSTVARSTMPAKQVYGKRAAAKSTSSYAKLISPDKDVVEEKKDATTKATRRAKAGKKDDVAVIEQGLINLDLGESATENQDMLSEKSNKPRRNGERRRKNAKKVEVVDLADDLNALNLDENKQLFKEDKVRGKTKRSPKKPEIKDDVPKAKQDVETSPTPEEQTMKPRKHVEEQTAPSKPVRGRKLKAVVIPQRTSSPKMAQLLTPDTTPEPEDPYTAYVSLLLSLSYSKNVITFADWSAALESYFEVTKIAEASFSEVYRLTALSTNPGSADESVLKLVALRTPPDAPLRNDSQNRESRNPDAQRKRNLEAREEEDHWKSHVDDVHSEVKLLQNLNHIPGFTNFRDVTVLQGRPSTMFNNAWKAWNKSRPRGKKSEFPDPSKKASYEDTQLWAVIEMQDAGTDCEKVMDAGGMTTVWEIWDVFWGVCLSIAKAEETCKFEHRDLHLENICIRSSRSQSENDLTKPVVMDPLRRKLGFTGLETTVIDYTLSRADILPSSPSRRSSSSPISSSSTFSKSSPQTPPSEREVAFLDLNKNMTIFNGDATEEYQYEIYRYMRGAVFYNDPLQSSSISPENLDTPRRSPRKTAQHIRFDDPETPTRRSPRKSMMNCYRYPPPDIWRHFHPKTNLVWAHFVLYMLLEHLQGNEPAELSDKQIMRNVDARVEEKGKVVTRARKLHKVLKKVAELLEPGVLGKEGSLGSVKELVVLAMEERWLRVEDVAG